jgi:hypothetical protein
MRFALTLLHGWHDARLCRDSCTAVCVQIAARPCVLGGLHGWDDSQCGVMAARLHGCKSHEWDVFVYIYGGTTFVLCLSQCGGGGTWPCSIWGVPLEGRQLWCVNMAVQYFRSTALRTAVCGVWMCDQNSEVFEMYCSKDGWCDVVRCVLTVVVVCWDLDHLPPLHKLSWMVISYIWSIKSP